MSKILRSELVALARRSAAALVALARRSAAALVALARRFAAALVALARRFAAARTLVWLALACAAAPGCKAECPPNTVESGKLCLFKRDAGEDVAANGGSSADVVVSGWSCTSVGLACVCRQDMTGPHGCSELPPCCFTSNDAGVEVCECWPTNSSECASAQSGQRPDAVIVAHCPPR